MENYRIKYMLFQQMVSCCHNFYFWEYDSELELLNSTCPVSDALNQCFLISFRSSDSIENVLQENTPILVSSTIQMMWIVIPSQTDAESLRLHVLGPFFISDVSNKNLDLILLRKGLSRSLRQQILELFHSLPIISWNIMMDYILMMGNSILNKKFSPSDVRFFTSPEHSDTEKTSPNKIAKNNGYTVHGTYQAEQKMLQMVRDGNLEVLEYMNTIGSIGEIGILCTHDALRQMQNSTEVGIILFSRAAIEGGLSPELAYNLTDQYFQAIEGCHSLSDLSSISSTMYRDFVERVHKCKMQQYSKTISQCCDYIMLHLEENITISDLATHTGYSDYYCSKKFKKETGMTPAQYIKEPRLKAAAKLLVTSNEEIQDIAIRYQFGSKSYFTDSFRKQYGVSPSEYRSKSQ